MNRRAGHDDTPISVDEVAARHDPLDHPATLGCDQTVTSARYRPGYQTPARYAGIGAGAGCQLPGSAVRSHRPLRLEVAERVADSVVGVPQLVLRDQGVPVVRRKNKVLAEHDGPEAPAFRRLQTAPEVLKALGGLDRVDDEARRLHAPRVSLRVVQEE